MLHVTFMLLNYNRRLPTAMTCFNRLVLPKYPNAHTLQERYTHTVNTPWYRPINIIPGTLNKINRGKNRIKKNHPTECIKIIRKAIINITIALYAQPTFCAWNYYDKLHPERKCLTCCFCVFTEWERLLKMLKDSVWFNITLKQCLYT